MALDTQNELMSVLGIDLPFIHGFPIPAPGVIGNQDLLALAHKSSAVSFSGPSIPLTPTAVHTAGTYRGSRGRTRFGSA